MKKTVKLFMAALFIGLLIFTGSCKKCTDMPLPKGQTLNVYVAGYDYNATTKAIIAAYWKNGSEVILSNNSQIGYATSIAIPGTDVYVAGYVYTANVPNFIACYWKNGIEVPLSDGTHNVYATSIAVAGSDIYVAGYEKSGTNYIAKYWKNGTEILLSDGTHDAYALSIAVSGSDVYVAGYENNGAINAYGNNGFNDVAKYWKNGSPVLLTDGTEIAHAYSIAVSGSDVYVCGQENVGIDPNSRNIAKYWKNNSPVDLSKVTNGNASATSITISGTDVYVAGYEDKGPYYFAEYWKNGTQMVLTADTSNGVANSIAVQGTDVYVAGYESSVDGHSSVAKYWKNSSQVLLTNPNGPYQTAASIVVVNQ